MAFPLFRFTLNNTIAGSLVISEPGGWDDAVLKLERNEEYHSLVEFYDQPLMFYGESSEGNGGLNYIVAIENSQGPDAQITIRIEVSEDFGGTYGVLYDGLLDITTIKESDFYKQECGIIRNDFWSKFINRKATDVDLSSTVDLDGGTRAVISPFTLSLPSQKVRQLFQANLATSFIFDSATDPYTNADTFQIDWDEEVISEIKTKYNLPNVVIPGGTGTSLFSIELDGDYTFDIRIEVTNGLPDPDYPNLHLDYYIQINNDAPIIFTPTNHNFGAVFPFYTSTSYAYSATLSLKIGDQIVIYGDIATNPAFGEIYYYLGKDWPHIPSGLANPTYFNITADTVYTDTTCEAWQIGAVGQSILTKLIGMDSALTSSYILGSGCGAYYGLMKGLHIRGYTLAQKPFFLSFEDYWAGINPILNLGLGYSGNQIEILKKGDFYNSTVILNLDYVNKIERSYNNKYIFKSIEAGYEKWSAESASGVDDPQSKRVYRTRFKTVGQDFKILSKFYAASLGIEQTRRNRAEQGKDWRLDDDTMIIALNKVSAIPELGTDFSAVTGLLNSATRYNIRLSVARNFKRWLAFFNGCLKWYATNDDFSFASGEGNFDMTSTLASSDCEGDDISLSEKQDIDGGAGVAFNFVPILYDFEYPLTYSQYKTIRDNKKNAIGISRTNTGHATCFIMNLEYQITHGKAKFTVMLGQSTPL